MTTVDPTAAPRLADGDVPARAGDVVRVFVSYSHKDPAYLADDSLLGFLKGLSGEAEVEFWTDERITASSIWNDEIRKQLAVTDIALVLVSQAFLDSPFCTQIEIESFLEGCRKRGLIIFPVVLSPCEWERHEWLATRQFLPGGSETIEEHYTEPGKQKRLFLRIRKELRQAVESVRQARAAAKPVEASPGFAEKRQLRLHPRYRLLRLRHQHLSGPAADRWQPHARRCAVQALAVPAFALIMAATASPARTSAASPRRRKCSTSAGSTTSPPTSK